MIYKPNQKYRYLKECEDASKKLKKRGLDRTYTQYNENFYLCFHRLCINDLSTNGDQPMIGTRGEIFMCNGEIYNYKQIIEKYNLNCLSHSDCEVILRLYEKGILESTLHEINGDFAFIIIDENKISLGRDRIGVRPLFIGWTWEHHIVVASEIKALSMCFTINHVAPGILSTMKAYSRYSRFAHLETFHVEPEQGKIKSLLENAVKIRLETDRPIGCLLSGGLDSSIICMLLCKFLGSENVRTYSIGLENSIDIKYAEKVSKYLNTKHTTVKITENDIVNNIENVIYHLESDDITTVRASIPMYLLCKYISENTEDKVIFSGEGSDELFCGYLYFHNSPSAEDLSDESLRLIKNMYKYDVLRADRCVSSNNLELRVPFLDKDLIDYVLSLDGKYKAPKEGLEKYLLRMEFKNDLPEEIIYRRKDGFSDGVMSEDTIPWFKKINEREIYTEIYKKHFNNFKMIDEYWLPKWTNEKDPSGRLIKIN